MAWLARTDGATSGEASELREGVLSDIPTADRGNWRVVTNDRPDIDNLTQQFVRTGLPIAGDGTVSVSWQITDEPVQVVKMRLSQLARQIAIETLETATIEVLGVRIRINDDTFASLKGGKDTIEAGVATSVGVVTATGEIVAANLSALNTALVAIVTARQAVFSAVATIMGAVTAGTVTTSAGVRTHAAWP